MKIEEVGHIVSVENRRSTWSGETIRFWGKYDMDYMKIPFNKMKEPLN